MMKQIRVNDEMEKYSSQLKSIPSLNQNEEYELIKKAQAGDINAKNEIIKANLKFVIRIAKSYTNQGVDYDDLVSEGSIGLMKAIEKFDLKKGCNFKSYAYWWIIHEIKIAIYNKSSIIHLPIRVRDKILLIKKIENDLYNCPNHEPTVEELALKANMPIEEVEKLMALSQKIISLDEIILNDKENEFEDDNNDEKEEIEKVIKKCDYENLVRILESIKGLSRREIDICLLRLGCVDGVNWTLEECARLFKISRAGVAILEKKAYQKIFESKKLYLMTDYSNDPKSAKDQVELRQQKVIEKIVSILKYLIDSDLFVQVFELKMGYIDGINYSDEQISEITGLKIEEVNAIFNYVLEKIRISLRKRKILVILDSKIEELLTNFVYQKSKIKVGKLK